MNIFMCIHPESRANHTRRFIKLVALNISTNFHGLLENTLIAFNKRKKNKKWNFFYFIKKKSINRYINRRKTFLKDFKDIFCGRLQTKNWQLSQISQTSNLLAYCISQNIWHAKYLQIISHFLIWLNTFFHRLNVLMFLEKIFDFLMIKGLWRRNKRVLFLLWIQKSCLYGVLAS